MRALSEIVGGGPAPAPRNRGYSWRREARFVLDVSRHCTPLDRNQRAKLIHQAEAIELRTKSKGRKSGVLGQTGLAVLRVLVFGFSNRVTGLCCPSIDAIRAKTGFCRQTVVRAIRALEAVGVIRAIRRLTRRMIERNGVRFVSAVQATNLYSFHLNGRINIAPLMVGKAKSFPSPNALIPLMFHPSMKIREKPHQGAFSKDSEGQARGIGAILSTVFTET